MWADGVPFNIRLEADRPCILVSTGAPADEKKGTRRRLGRLPFEQTIVEGITARRAVSRTAGRSPMGRRGRNVRWLEKRCSRSQVQPATREQNALGSTTQLMCWINWEREISRQGNSLRSGWLTTGPANWAFGMFVERYEAQYPKATARGSKDKGESWELYELASGARAAHPHPELHPEDVRQVRPGRHKNQVGADRLLDGGSSSGCTQPRRTGDLSTLPYSSRRPCWQPFSRCSWSHNPARRIRRLPQILSVTYHSNISILRPPLQRFIAGHSTTRVNQQASLMTLSFQQSDVDVDESKAWPALPLRDRPRPSC